MGTQSALFRTRRFMPLFLTQFFGALNDNVLKNAMVLLLTFQTAAWTSLPPEVLVNLAAGLFILPFFLFSATAGQLADKYDMAGLARTVKLFEIVIIVIAAVGFIQHQLAILLLSLFMLGLHSTLFGPIKYALLPQHLHESELVGGNALVEAGTFIAILFGTLLGGLLAASPDSTALIAGTGLAIAVAGYLASLGIPVARPPAPALRIHLNPLTETWHCVQFAGADRTVFLSIMGISWFWLFGALFLAQFPVYTRQYLGGAESAVTLLLGAFTLGIGLGSLLCERMSAGRIEVALVPLGSIGLSLFAFDLAFASPDQLVSAGAALDIPSLLSQPYAWRVLADLLLIGVFGGFFIVPLYALVQQRSNPQARARIIAGNNIFNALFMVVGAAAAAAMLGHGLGIPQLFATAALCNIAVAIFIYRLVPEFMQRFLRWFRR